MIACCGLNCSKCLAYEATQANDDAKRKEVAEQWSKEYNTLFLPEQINCDGCTGNGKLVGYAEHFCSTRKCCREKNLSTCADCPEYPCQNLSEFHKNVPEAKANLDALRK